MSQSFASPFRLKLMHKHAALQWTASDYLGLPEVQRDEDLAVQRWQIVAGGLALVLSRLTPTERRASFSSSDRLYAYVERRLRQGRPVQAAPEALSDVMHELAEWADPATRKALRACFQASLRAHEGKPLAALESQPRPEDGFSFSVTVPTSALRSAPAGKR